MLALRRRPPPHPPKTTPSWPGLQMVVSPPPLAARYDALTGHIRRGAPDDHYARSPVLTLGQPHGSSQRNEKALQWSEDIADDEPVPSSARLSARDYGMGDPVDRARARSLSPRPSSRDGSSTPRTPRTPRGGGGSSPSTPRSGSPLTPRSGSSTPRGLSTPRLWSPRSNAPDADDEGDEGARVGGGRAPIDVNIFFQNIRLAPLAPRQTELSVKYALPEEIFFFVHVSTYPCGFPLPREYPEHKYLHRASVHTGHEAAGPAWQGRFNPSTVVGLKPHQMTNGRCLEPSLVLVVPVTRRVNPYLAPKSLRFQPSLPAQLHSSQHLPRIIVPVMPLGFSGQGSQVGAMPTPRTHAVHARARCVCGRGIPALTPSFAPRRHCVLFGSSPPPSSRRQRRSHSRRSCAHGTHRRAGSGCTLPSRGGRRCATPCTPRSNRRRVKTPT